jgi:pyruvate,water dikinase
VNRDDANLAVSEPSVTLAQGRTSRTGSFTLPLGAVRLKDLPRVGGKAARLGERIAAGLPVPPGWVITTDAWRRFVQSDSRIPEWLQSLAGCDPRDPAALRVAADDLRSRLADVSMPADVAEAILAVAVVNVGPATKIIRTGPWLQVDADRCVVRVFEEFCIA